MNKISILIIIVLGLGIVGYSSTYILDEGEQAVITQFGKPVGQPVTEAGLHFVKPFIQKVIRVQKRILSWDGYPNQIPTKDKKYIHVDTTARWKIVDALRYIQSVQNERGAKARLDSILDANTRDVISNHNLVEAVRNTNDIFELMDKRKKEREQDSGNIEEEVSGEIERIGVGREQLSELIAQKSGKELKEFGIEIIDVHLRRISYEESVEKKVYERMISERKRIAEKIRSIGKGEKAKILGRLSRDLQKIESAAYQRAETIKGQGQARAIAVYNKSFSKNKKFYYFMKTLDGYKKSLGKSKMILGPDFEYLKGLKKMNFD